MNRLKLNKALLDILFETPASFEEILGKVAGALNVTKEEIRKLLKNALDVFRNYGVVEERNGFISLRGQSYHTGASSNDNQSGVRIDDEFFQAINAKMTEEMEKLRVPMKRKIKKRVSFASPLLSTIQFSPEEIIDAGSASEETNLSEEISKDPRILKFEANTSDLSEASPKDPRIIKFDAKTSDLRVIYAKEPLKALKPEAKSPDLKVIYSNEPKIKKSVESPTDLSKTKLKDPPKISKTDGKIKDLKPVKPKDPRITKFDAKTSELKVIYSKEPKDLKSDGKTTIQKQINTKDQLVLKYDEYSIPTTSSGAKKKVNVKKPLAKVSKAKKVYKSTQVSNKQLIKKKTSSSSVIPRKEMLKPAPKKDKI